VTFAMTFKKFDAGEFHRTSKLQAADCQVRALCVAADIHYCAAYDLLYKAQGELRTPGFFLEHYLRHKAEMFGVMQYIPFPAVAGQSRMTGMNFVQHYPKGRYILRLSNHFAAVVDGTLLDSWDCTRKCVYGAWEIRKGKK
jgi:hypothetical protein